MSEPRATWLFLSVSVTVWALFVLGLGLFNVGANDPSNQLVYSFCAPCVLNWLAYFGSRA
mgnify:CR=1 FL=1